MRDQTGQEMRSTRPLIAIFAYLLSISTANAANFAYVPINADPGMVEVVNMTNNTWVKSINVGSKADTSVVNPSGTRVYVGVLGPEDTGAISVIDTARNKVLKTIIDVTGRSTELVVSPDGTKLFCSQSRGVDMIDLDEKGVQPFKVTPISLVYSGQGLAITSDGQYVVVAGSKTTGGDLWGVSLVNAKTGAKISDLNLAKDATGVAVNGEFAYVTNRSGDTVTVLQIMDYDTPVAASLQKIGTPIALAKGSGPYDLVVDKTYGRLIVSNSGAPTVQALPSESTEGSLALISLTTQAVTYITLSMEGNISFTQPVVHPQGISLSKDGKTLYVTKDLWAQQPGTFVSTFTVNSAGLSRETSMGYAINTNNTLTMGDFVGPDCKNCPLSAEPEVTLSRGRPGSFGPFELAVLGIFAAGAARRRSRRK